MTKGDPTTPDHQKRHSSNFQDLTGKSFGRWTVVRLASSPPARWLCRCECGNERIVKAQPLKTGDSTSCGCRSSEVRASRMRALNRTHGATDSPTFQSWMRMRHRCSKPNSKDYKRYGGRGIAVCERWALFENFLADMGERPPGMTLDRIDNNGPYSPENCRWATASQQQRNKRNSQRLTYRNETMSVMDWADRVGIPWYRVKSRLRLGWDIEHALFVPYSRGRRRAAILTADAIAGPELARRALEGEE